MSDIHITPELLEAVERGEIPARILAEAGLSHLLSLCSTCRDGVREWERRRNAPLSSYESAFRVLPFVLERHGKEVEEQLERAEKDLGELLKLPQQARLARVRRASTRFRGVGLAQRLLQEAGKHIPADPGKVHELAEVAEAVLLRAPHVPGYFDALTRALAYRANTLRAIGRVREADERMRSARALIRNEDVKDVLVYAEVDWLEGVLRKDQRRFKDAEYLLSRSASLFRIAGEVVASARPLLALGLLYNERQNPSRAIEVTQAVLESLSPEVEPRLCCYARHNITLFLVEAGRFEEAAAFLEESRAFYRQFPDLYTQSRLGWIEGKIASGQGRLEEAERLFRALREEFIEQGNGYDAAMVSMDLALLYSRQGRLVEIKQLAEEMH